MAVGLSILGQRDKSRDLENTLNEAILVDRQGFAFQKAEVKNIRLLLSCVILASKVTLL